MDNYSTILLHTGVGHDDNPPGRGSGRFGWGTGENPGQHQYNFISEVARLKAKGFKDGEIATMLLGQKNGKDRKAVDLRAELSIAKSELKQINIQRGWDMLEKCNGNMSEAARRLGMKNESSLRSLLDPIKAERRDRYKNTAEMIKKVVDEKGMVDISKGNELYLGVTRNTMDIAVLILEKEGYLVSYASIPQMTTTHETGIKVLATPGTTHGDVQRNKFQIQSIDTFTPDEGKTWWKPEFPESLDSSRIKIRYAEEGGREKDGVIELTRGVEDISLGDSQYAQVRIAVDGTSYMKGMAVYADDKDFPKGVDIIYNTNKSVGTPMINKDAYYDYEKHDFVGKEVLKRLKIDEGTGKIDKDNPFGATIKIPKERDGVLMAGGQRHYIDSNGKERLSPINKIQEEGDWDSWSRNLSSQFLSKQPLKLIKQQLDLSVADKKVELEEINRLTNPVIRKKMLEDFARGCDANASDLSAKGFKNQAFQVILPVTSLKDNECYAPNFNDGEVVALVRYPHGGIFEIPILKVNNRNEAAKKVMKGATDAIGINVNVADQLSGADFDGDTVLAIPISSNNLNISSRKPLSGLKDFDGKALYKLPDNAPKMTSRTKQIQMGEVSNLITDMTIDGGAGWDEIARAVRHSMVVIDAEKHHLDYKKSAVDNDINSLKREYQGYNEKTGRVKGASTILSKAGSEVKIPERRELTDVNKMTPEELKRWNNGEVIWRETGKTKKSLITDVNKMTQEELKLHEAGKKVYRQTNDPKTMDVSRMDTVRDAMDLVRNKSNAKEVAYANFANELKALANEARRESRSIKPTKVNQSAKETYAEEVESLNASLNIALRNDPRERQAQRIANEMMRIKLKDNPYMDHEHRQRENARALTEARAIVGAKKERIQISDREWEAIQANAISTNKLIQILDNTDQEAFKKRATPKAIPTLTNNEIALAKSMMNSGMYTQKEIADKFGVSASTVSKAIRS